MGKKNFLHIVPFEMLKLIWNTLQETFCSKVASDIVAIATDKRSLATLPGCQQNARSLSGDRS
jgi:hypothetical protein